MEYVYKCIVDTVSFVKLSMRMRNEFSNSGTWKSVRAPPVLFRMWRLSLVILVTGAKLWFRQFGGGHRRWIFSNVKYFRFFFEKVIYFAILHLQPITSLGFWKPGTGADQKRLDDVSRFKNFSFPTLNIIQILMNVYRNVSSLENIFFLVRARTLAN